MKKEKPVSPDSDPGCRVSLKKLAELLGTSECTVSKALHDKPKVSPAMRARVMELSKKLGYRPNLLARSMARNPLRIAVISPEAWPSYYKNIIRGVFDRAKELQDYRIEVISFHYSDFSDSRGCTAALADASMHKLDALILLTGTFPQEESAALTDQAARMACPVLLLGGGFVPDCKILCHVKQNSFHCGSMAGNLAAVLFPEGGTAAVIIGRMDLEDHRRKIEGFRDVLRKTPVHFAGIGESLDRENDAYRAVENLFRAAPDISLLYIGTENISGVLSYFEEHSLTGKVRCIATGYSKPVLAALRNDAVQFAIDENLFQQGRVGMNAVFQYLTLGKPPASSIEVEPTLLLKYNAAFRRQNE